MGVSKQAIQQHLKPLMDMIGDPAQLKAYQANKAVVFDGIQKALAGRLLDKEKIQKANLGNVAYAMRQLNDMMRLERELSTENVAVAHINALKTIEEVDEEIANITKDMDTQSASDGEGEEELANPRLIAVDEEINRLMTQGIDVPTDIDDDDSPGTG